MKKKKCEETVKGVVTRVFFNRDGFFSGVLRAQAGATVRVCGAMTAKENEAVIVRGSFEHNKYGRQFRVASFEYDMAFDAEGIVNYLVRNPAMKGIGMSRAREIADFCGDDFDAIVTDDPKQLLAIRGVTPDIVEHLHAEWVKHKSINKTITFLAGFGITHKQINALIDKYGNFALQAMKDNPYQIIDDIPGYGFKKADIIALKMGVSKSDPNRIQAGLQYLLQKSVQDGDTWFESEDLVARANKLLIMDGLDSMDIIRNQLDAMLKENRLVEYQFDNRTLVSLPSIFHQEAFIGDTFRRICGKQ
jgi:exodeoxyribonuclease V alpha subunit